MTLTPLGVFNLETGATFPAVDARPIGGVSACLRDASGDTLAISDSPEHPVIYRFAVRWDGTVLRVDPRSATTVETSSPGAPSRLDLEGMALTPRGTLVLSSEGHDGAEPAALLEYTLDGRYRASLPLPAAYRPSGSGHPQGLRHNAAFEPLTAVDAARLLVGTEQPLAQDDQPAGIGRGAMGRLLEFVSRGDSWLPGREFAYPIAPMPAPGVRVRGADTGLVELLPIGGERFLAMERGFVQVERGDGPSYNVVRLYDVSLEGADDIAGRLTLREGRPIRPVSKTLVANLDDWRERLGSGLATLDNFEALCEGPAVDGARTVLIISDNNFNAWQRTSFVLAAIEVRD